MVTSIIFGSCEVSVWTAAFAAEKASRRYHLSRRLVLHGARARASASMDGAAPWTDPDEMAGPPRLPLDPLSAAKKRVGETLCGKWRIDRLIDTGGMAAVFEATHRNGKKVAIKMLFPHISAIAEVKERFLREGYVANKVDHSGAVSVL